jgi:DNA-binding transcriptional LysR family regulator
VQSAAKRVRVSARLLPEFLEAYPDVQVELCGDDNFIDLVEQGFDAGLEWRGRFRRI